MTDLFGNVDEEGLYQMAIAVPLQEKIESAIMLIRSCENMALSISPDGYYNCDSGGKDSGVVKRLVEMSGAKHINHYSNTTIDPPELIYHLKRTSPDTVWHSKGIHLPMYMAKKAIGPPTRSCRWCCEIYKEQGGKGQFKMVGVRADESPRRKGLWKQVKPDSGNGSMIISPILFWTEQNVWDFTHAENIPYCELYDQGFKRLGCVGCPLAGPVQQRIEFERWPKYKELWQRGFRAHWDRYKEQLRKDGTERWSNYTSWTQLWDWWMEESNVNDTDAPDCQGYLW